MRATGAMARRVILAARPGQANVDRSGGVLPEEPAHFPYRWTFEA
jgi:hypothetical protein